MFIDIGTAVIALAVLLAVVVFLQCIKNIVFAKKINKLKKEQEIETSKLKEDIKLLRIDLNKNVDSVDSLRKATSNVNSELKNNVAELQTLIEKQRKNLFTVEEKTRMATLHLERFKEKYDSDTKELENKLFEQGANSLTQFKKQEEVIHSLENEIKVIIDQYNDIKNEIETKVSKTEQDFLAKIQEQSEKSLSIEAECKELKRKLEIFTEIESDSMRLNSEEDEKAKEELIARALKEFSQEMNKHIVSSGDEKDVKEIQQKKEHISENDSNNIEFEKDASNEEFPAAESIDEQAQSEKNESQEHKADNKEKEENSNLPKQITKTVYSNISSVLDDDQKHAYHLMETTNDNCFVTGKAGTGKSFLLQMFEKGTKKKILKLAPTGVAALHIGGATIHSAFGMSNLNVDIDDLNERTLLLKQQKRELLQKLDTIIIDEVSMVRADVLEKIEKILRIVNKTSLPFGGKQMLLFGDVFQLSPIASREEIHYLKDRYEGIHFFNSNSYKNGNFRFVELVTNHRQKGDTAFFEILNRIREGKVNKNDIDRINERYFQGDTRELRRIVRLYPKKADAEEINSKELDAIPAKEYVFSHHEVFNTMGNQNFKLENNFQISSELKIKVGALVMMTRNDINKRWVNGTLAIVSQIKSQTVDIELENGDVYSAPIIEVTVNGRKYDVLPCEWEQKEAEYKNGKIKYKTVYKTYQYPMILAYAITIHKSQGMTYKDVACAPGKTFASGQAYVALSRCESLDGLYLLDRLTAEEIKVDPQVSEFYLNAKNIHQ